MAKSKNIPDDKDIYLAFSTVFKGSCAQIRKASAIQRLVKQSEKQTEVAQFFARNNHKSMRAVIYDRLKVLLEQRVFESYSRARLRFPDLFVETATQTAERAASEAMAATDHARAVEGALLGDQEVVDDTFTDSDETCARPDVVFPDTFLTPPFQKHLAATGLPNGPRIPPLFPVRLPFITGHQIMLEAQAILEQACFDFTQHRMPEVLATRGWDCAAAVELNIWVKMMRKQEHRLFNATLTDLEIDRASFYKSLCDIRHTAVHRLPMTAAGIEKCLRDGELLANLIDDSAAATRISTMRCEVQRVSTEMEDHKCMLEAKMNRTLERIAAERAELDRQEREAIEGTAQADEEYQLYAAANLEQRLANCEDDVTTESETSGSMMMAMRTVWNMSGSSWERLWTTLRSSAFDRFVSPEQLDGSVDAQT